MSLVFVPHLPHYRYPLSTSVSCIPDLWPSCVIDPWGSMFLVLCLVGVPHLSPSTIPLILFIIHTTHLITHYVFLNSISSSSLIYVLYLSPCSCSLPVPHVPYLCLIYVSPICSLQFCHSSTCKCYWSISQICVHQLRSYSVILISVPHLCPSPTSLTKVSSLCCSSITISFKKLVTEGRLPKGWKFGDVVPIDKIRDKKCVSNYCPISLASVAGETMEKNLIKKKLQNF